MVETEFFSGNLVSTFLLGLITVVLLYWYSVRNHNYWKERGVPTAKTIPFLGTTLDSFSKANHEIMMERFRQHGRMYGVFEGNTPGLLIAEPALLRDILVKDFQFFPDRQDFASGDKVFNSTLIALKGEDWKRVRNLVTPTFTTGKIKKLLGIFKDCCKTLIQNIKNATGSGQPIDVKPMYGAFVMDNIASSAFSTKIDSHNDPDNEFIRAAKGVFTEGFNWKSLLFLIAPRLMISLGASIFRKESTQFFKRVTLEIIQERERTGQGRNDFLQLLLDTAKEVSEEDKCNLSEKESGDIASNYGDDVQQIFKNVSSKHLTMDELVAQCVIFFLAGIDTVATTLSIATYLLALNPEIQDKLREEVDEALMETDGELTYDCIQSMKYMDNVISETLRLYPTALGLGRLAVSDYKLGDTGIIIPKGMQIGIPVYAMHRDPEYFPDPETFDPNRFTVEERAKRDQYTYLPFGAGPRNCVGKRFALMEMKVCLATVIATFKIKRCPQTKVPLEFEKSLGVLEPKETIVEMEARTDSHLTN